MTAHAMSGDPAKSIAVGMNDHITKPIDPGMLLEALSKWIKPRTQTRRTPIGNAPVPADQSSAGIPHEPILPEKLPGFDLMEGLHRLQGNQALYRRLLLNFAELHRHEAETLHRALDEGDVDRARHRVHAIKGVAGNLGAKPLQAATAVLEKLITSADPERRPDAEALETAVQAFKAALDVALTAAGSLMPAGSDRKECSAGNPTQGFAPEIPADITADLRAAAELGDVSEITALARGISARSGGLSTTGKRILRMVENFDFEGILKLVDELEAPR
jgi:HPt (histidine-containing phosphotransfer) domain-containing protein